MNIAGGLGAGKIIVDGTLKMSNSSIGNRMIFSEAQIYGELIASDLSIGTWGSLGKTTLKKDVYLNGLKVGTKLKPEELYTGKHDPEKIIPGSFYFDGSTFAGNLTLSKANIKGSLYLNDANGHGEIDLTALEIGHSLVLSKSYFRGMLRCDGATLKRDLASYKTRFKEEVSFNSISCDNAALCNSSFDNGFTMRSAKIENVLNLNNVDVDGKADFFKCKFDRIFFLNFLTDYFLINRDCLGKHLTSEKLKNYEQAKIEYGILKHSFQMQNLYKDMDWAYYHFCRNRRKSILQKSKSPFKKIISFFDWLLLDLGFGYGTRPMNIAVVACSVILIFALFFYYVPQGLVDTNGYPLKYIQFLDSIYLSIVTFACMDYGDCYPLFSHWLKHLCALEGLLGIFLTTLFVATISRKIIRT